MSDDWEFNPETDYLLLSEAGWVIIDQIEELLELGMGIDQVAAAIGYPLQDLLALMCIAESNRMDLEVGIRADQ